MVIAMCLIGPILLFLAGAAWSAVLGWSLTEDADSRAETADAAA
jgi:hypothetical protein